MRKVTFILPSLSLGGAERSLVKAANLLAAAHKVSVVVLCSGDHLLAGDLDASINVVMMHARGTASPALWYRTRQVLLKQSPDTVVGWSTYGNLVAIVASYKTAVEKLVLSERNFLPKMLGRDRTNPIRRLIVTSLIRRLYPRADMITANSEGSLKFLRRFVGAGPAYLKLPNIIGFTQLANCDEENGRELPDAPRELVRLLAIGRFDSQKGIDILLRALLTIPKSCGIALMIVGTGPEERTVLRGVARLRLLSCNPYVWVLPADAMPGKYYRWADIVVVPSRYEGFPNVLLEAMASGKPVVASNCRTGPAEITDGGKFGVLVPVDDAAALGTAITHLCAQRMELPARGEAARNHVLRIHSPETLAATYARIA